MPQLWVDLQQAVRLKQVESVSEILETIMPSEFVTLMTFLNVADAEVKRLLLEEEGIKTYLSDAEIVSMDWLLGNAVGSIKLQVATADAERAVAILQSAPPSTPALLRKDNQCLACGAIMPDDADTCPQCGWSYGNEPTASTET